MRFLLTLSVGFLYSQLAKYPSRPFLVALTVIGIAFSMALAHSIAPLLSLLPGFLQEWWTQGTAQNFPAYLALTSYSLLIIAAVSQVKRFVFVVACELRSRFGITIVP